MKLNNNLIVTLSDFARYFDYSSFWENRKQFVRDMHPNKVYYWNKELEKAYNDIVTWINEDDSATETVVYKGINALELIINRKINNGEICNCNGKTDLTSAIIRVQVGTTLELPEYVAGSTNNNNIINLFYHKIEVYGRSEKPAIIKIGTKDRIELYATDFTYVTEVNNQFIEFLPTQIDNGKYSLSLFSQEGVFLSNLYVKTKLSGNEVSFKDVISFAVTNDEYIFIDSNGTPIIMMSNRTLALKAMLRYDKEAFCVKAKGTEAMILYKDGTLKSTNKYDSFNRIIAADFGDDNNLNIYKY